MNFNNILSDKNWVFGNKILFIDSYSLLKDISYKNIYLDELNHLKLEKRKVNNNIKIWKFRAKIKNMKEFTES